MSPTSPPTLILLSSLTHLALYSQASALSYQDLPSSSSSLPTLKLLSKGSSLELQGVESNVYILFCLISPIPCDALRNRKKNLLLYLGLCPALLFDEGILGIRNEEEGESQDLGVY